MSAESDARLSFGVLVKNFRAERKLTRHQFARKVGVKREVIVRLEHGVPNPTRPELVRIINVLNLPQKDKNRLYELLRVFSPRRKQKVKFHLHVMVLRHRNRRYNR